MNRFIATLVGLLVMTQILGPAGLWATETEPQATVEDIRDGGIIAALYGDAQRNLAGGPASSQPLQFRDLVGKGDSIVTGMGSVTDVLLGTHSLVTIGSESAVNFEQDATGQTIVKLNTGSVQIAGTERVRALNEFVTLETLHSRALVRGGLMKATVGWNQRNNASDTVNSPNVPTLGLGRVDTYDVIEGAIEVESLGGAKKRVAIEAGQTIQVVDGVIGEVYSTPAVQILGALPAIHAHENIPEQGTEYLVANQMTQAQLLECQLFGSNEHEQGCTAASENTLTGQERNNSNVVLATTLGVPLEEDPMMMPGGGGSTGGGGGSTGGGGGSTDIADIPPSVESTVRGVFEDSTTPNLDIILGPSLVTMLPGGGGLLVIQNSKVTLNQELLLVDGGALNQAHHKGSAPTGQLVLHNFSGGNTSIVINQSPQQTPVVHTKATTPGGALNVLLQYSASPLSSPSPFPVNGDSGDNNINVDQLEVLLGAGGGSGDGSQGSALNASIRARSGPGGQTVILRGGAVVSNTSLRTGPTAATQKNVPGLDGSLVAVIGRDGGGTLQPANVILQDRALAIMNGSTVAPGSSQSKVSLLTLLDSTLTGPSAPPRLPAGDVQPSGVQSGFLRNDTPALIEIAGSQTSTTSAFVVKSVLDKAILTASAPLLTAWNSTVETTSDLINVDGKSAQLLASIPNDQLTLQAAVQLNNSTLDIGRHLVNVTGGGSVNIVGNLVAVTNNSTLNIAGFLVNVGAGSAFSLTGGSLIAFGTGSNSVTLTGGIGSCAGCSISNSIPNLAGLPVLLHPSATVNVGQGFIPVSGQGSLNINPDAAFIQVGQGASLTLAP